MTQKIERFSANGVSESSRDITAKDWQYRKGLYHEEYFGHLLELYSHPVQLAYIKVMIELRRVMRLRNAYPPEELRNSVIVACNVAERALQKEVFTHLRDTQRNLGKLFQPDGTNTDRYIDDGEFHPFFISRLKVMIWLVRTFFGENALALYRQQIERELEKANEYDTRVMLTEEITKILKKLRLSLTDPETRSSHYTLIWASLNRHLSELDLPPDLGEHISRAL